MRSTSPLARIRFLIGQMKMGSGVGSRTLQFGAIEAAVSDAEKEVRSLKQRARDLEEQLRKIKGEDAPAGEAVSDEDQARPPDPASDPSQHEGP